MNQTDASRKATVLIVDDRSANQRRLSELLADKYGVLIANSAEEAFEQFTAEAAPDIALLRVALPGVGAGEVCRQLLEHEVPVVLLSENHDVFEEEEGLLRLGAADCLCEPFRPALVETRVRNELHRRQTERELAVHLSLERTVSQISAQLVGCDPHDVDTCIENALAALGEFAEADRAYVFLLSGDTGQATNTHEWCAEGIEPQMDGLQAVDVAKQLPWFSGVIQSQSVFHVPDVDALPPAAQAEREHFVAQGIRSLVAVPMRVRETLRGFLGFDAVTERRAWSDEVLTAMRLVAQTFAHALERQGTVNALRDSEERLRTTLHSIGDAVVSTDRDGKVVQMNPVAEQLTGWTFEEAAGIPLEDVFRIVNGRTREEVANPVRRVLKEGRSVGLANHTVLLSRDGAEYQIADSASPIRDAAGETMGVVLVFRDVTEEYAHQEQIRDSESKFRSLFEQSGDGALIASPEGLVVDANVRLCELTGYSAAELRGKRVADLYAPGWRPRRRDRPFGDTLATRGTDTFRTRLQKKTGDIFDVEINAAVVTLRAGVAIQASVRDITARLYWEQEYHRLFNEMLDGFALHEIIRDEDGAPVDYRFLTVNPAFERITGLSRDVAGQTVLEVMPDTEKRWIDTYGRVVDTGEPVHFEREAQVLGKTFEVTAFRNAPDQFACIFKDISDRKRAERQMREAKEQADAANLAKRQFLANMSHEIRTPLNAIVGMNQILAQTELDNAQRDYVDKISRSSQLLLGIINDILDLSKIEAGALELGSEAFSVDDLLTQVKSVFGLSAAEKGVELLLRASPNVPKTLVGDPLRLGQVINNLVGNALKFTHEGEVHLRTSLAEQPAEADAAVRVRFEVADTGIGMTEDQIDSLFHPFAQAEPETAHKYGGTGLGLVISERLVQAMGGNLEIHSEPGKGTAFRFELDMAPRPDEEQDEWERLDIQTAVVAAPSAQARGVVRDIFEANRIAVTEAEGPTALLRAIEDVHSRGAHFDCIVLDSSLAVDAPLLGLMEGIRSSHAESDPHGPPKPIIVLAAYRRDEVPSAPECDAFLSKPVTSSALFRALAEASRVAPKPKPDTIAALPPVLDGVSVLLAEDNEVNLEVAVNLLRRTRASIAVAHNGKEAVEAVEKQHFDLVLMDLLMPVMDGFDATREIRRRHPDLPILTLSAAAMVEDRRRAAEAGANEHISKPILCGTLYDAMTRWLDIAAPPCDYGSAPSKPDPASLAALPDSMTGFDLEEGLAMVNNNPDDYRELLFVFKEQLERNLGDTLDCLERGDRAAAEHKSHTLKGAAGAVGAARLAAAATTVNRALKTEAAVTDAAVEELAEAIAEVRRGLAALENDS